MTREEAIEVIKQDIPCEQDADLIEAFDMAIQALSQEQTDIEQKTQEYEKAFMDGFESCSDLFTRNKEQQPCADVVSRQAVINLIRGCNSALEEPRIFDCHNTGVKFEQYVTELPSVTRQTGEWILLDECANSGYYCSRCQKKLVKEGWSDTVKKIKFCPNCGAKMVEPQESEET